MIKPFNALSRLAHHFEIVCHCVFQDMSSVNTYDAGVALSGLACFITSDLARDLANDIMTLVSCSCSLKPLPSD